MNGVLLWLLIICIIISVIARWGIMLLLVVAVIFVFFWVSLKKPKKAKLEYELK